MRSIPAGLLTSAGLVGGFAVSKATKHRHWGGAVAALAGIGAAESCRRRTGMARASVLAVTYASALAGSHPLARKIGAWPAVCTVTAGTAGAAALLSRRTAK
ncbi:hypothetical protein [Parasphingorhabdus pacifica]